MYNWIHHQGERNKQGEHDSDTEGRGGGGLYVIATVMVCPGQSARCVDQRRLSLLQLSCNFEGAANNRELDS